MLLQTFYLNLTFCVFLYSFVMFSACLSNTLVTASRVVQIYIVMEHAGHGDLLEYIKLRGPIPEDKSRFMFKQICSAVSYLHSNNIAHRFVYLQTSPRK